MKFQKHKILFFAESLTLAHVTRPWTLALYLADQNFEVYFAVSDLPSNLKNNVRDVKIIELKTSIDSKLFSTELEKGSLPFTEEVLLTQVQEDIKIIQDIKPDLVVGDFRLSLSFSSKLAQVPYININNICWSPNAIQKSIVPNVELRHKWGLLISQLIFKLGKSNIYKSLAKPFNSVSKKLGLEINFESILQVYCDGDRVFFADVDNLLPTSTLPSHHVVGGPINFSFPNSNTIQYADFPVERPIVCITLGSSGPSQMLEPIIEELSHLPLNIIVSTAGKKIKEFNSRNVKVEKYVSISEISKIADLVICSGGSATAYPCLSEGVPLLAIPSNLDQFQFAQALENKGVAKVLRPESILQDRVLYAAVKEILFNSNYKNNAVKFKNEILKYDSCIIFQELIENLLTKSNTQKPSITEITNNLNSQTQFTNLLSKNTNTNKKILLTGANGFLGSNFLRLFPNVIIFDRNKYDIHEISSFQHIIEDVDVVVHFAGVNSGTSYNPTVAELSDGNMFVTSQLLRAIRSFNKKKPQFVFMSSIHVYDKSNTVFTESLHPMPNSPYGSMKYAQELLITQAAESGIIRALIFRAGHIYGPKSRPFYNSAIATICHKALNAEPVDLYGNGQVEFDLTYVDDVIKYIGLGIEKNMVDAITILNLGSGQCLNISQIVNVLECVIKKPILKNLVSSPVQKNSICIDKLIQQLGPINYTPLQLGLMQQIAALTDHQSKTESTLST